MKTCPACGDCKPDDRFGRNKRTCKDCFNAREREWRRQNPKEAAELSRMHAKAWRAANLEHARSEARKRRARDPDKINLRVRANRYGISVEDMKFLTQRCGKRCEVCGSQYRLCIDHDHTKPSGRESIRGILCGRCNITVGFYEKGWRPGGRVRAFDGYLSRPCPFLPETKNDSESPAQIPLCWASTPPGAGGLP